MIDFSFLNFHARTADLDHRRHSISLQATGGFWREAVGRSLISMGLFSGIGAKAKRQRGPAGHRHRRPRITNYTNMGVIAKDQ